MDGHSHHDHQKRDFQVSKKVVTHSCEGLKMKQGEGVGQKDSIHKSACVYVSLRMCARI